jgi:PAS domain S-box-containing protein
VIFLTPANSDLGSVLDQYTGGAVDFLVKPFEPEILRCKVSLFVDLFVKEQTIRHQAAVLRQQELDAVERQKFRNLTDAMPLCVVVTDNVGRPVYWNENALTYTGIAPDRISSREAFLDTLHPTEREHLAQQWNESIISHRQFELKFRIRGRDGLYRWHLGRGIPQRDDADRITGWILTATDIEIENQAWAHAEAANRIQDEFLATVSHELRNPLNAIIGWVHLLRAGNLDPAKSKRALETIERNVHQQVSLIDEILDLSRIAKGKVRLTLRTVDLIPLIQRALDTIRPAAAAKGVLLAWEGNGPPVCVNGDSERLQQVISNLISNAVKFTPARGRVSITLERDEYATILVARDTGRDSAEFLPFVFDMFRQADSSITRDHHGEDLRLAIARKLVELHGGRISARNEGMGRGAAFSVSLPSASFAGQGAAAAWLQVSQARPGALQGMRILVVEDQADSRDALGEHLRTLGADTTTAKSTQEALAAIGREVPDVLITDAAMPGQDGFSLMRSLNQQAKKQSHRFVSIALTGVSDPQHAQRALQAGFDICMVKPLDLSNLVANILRRIPSGPPSSS